MNRSGRSVAQQAGFTLIELIMVVVILGVLSAFALPRFANFRGDAVLAAAQSMQGAVVSAANIAHAQWLVNPQNDANGNFVTLDGQRVNIVNGYPAGTAAGIVAALARIDGFNTGVAAGVVTFTSQSNAACLFTFTAALANAAPAITAPVAANCT